MTTFVLLPGARLGPWCWADVVDALEVRGHAGRPVDLPCDDPSADFDRYVEVTRRAIAGADDAVLVGHGLGAHTAVRAAHRMSKRAVLFVCGAIPPRAGEDTRDEPALEAPTALEGQERDEEGRTFFRDPADAIRDFFPDLEPARAAWAAAQLRSQATTPYQAIDDPVSPPAAPCASIVCTDDRIATAAWGRWAARERLFDAPVVELPGSHSPFLSRPEALADAMVGLLSSL
jgi:pimeloyl-ACP methyl ester carboxylesterase